VFDFCFLFFASDRGFFRGESGHSDCGSKITFCGANLTCTDVQKKFRLHEIGSRASAKVKTLEQGGQGRGVETPRFHLAESGEAKNNICYRGTETARKQPATSERFGAND